MDKKEVQDGMATLKLSVELLYEIPEYALLVYLQLIQLQVQGLVNLLEEKK